MCPLTTVGPTTMRYGAAQDALRTYLAGRAPQFSRYMLMPTLGDHGVMRSNHGFRRDAISLAATVGLLDSMLFGLVGGLLVSTGGNGWFPAMVAAVLFTAAFASHLRYIRIAMSTCGAEIAAFLRERGLRE